MVSNKKLGTDFENEFCDLLASRGYWVHFISPAPNGGQPFDIIAVKGGEAYAYDCKTSVTRRFSISRLEENQKLAFERWIRCGNNTPRIAVKFEDRIYIVSYSDLKALQTIDLLRDSVCLDYC